MPVVSDHEGELRCVGSAFAVAPGLALTAAHVVDEWRSYQERRDGYRRPDVTLGVAAFQWFDGTVYQWDVDAVYVSASADIAFLRFRRPPWWGREPGQVRLPCARLNFNPPQVGDELQVFGFPDSTVDGDKLAVTPAQCSTRVRHVVLKSEGRFRPFSHLEVDGEIAGGMSGGPCFDAEWNVVGVNAKGWKFLEGPPVACVALLWPAMAIEIDPFKTGAFPALELFAAAEARALGYRRVQVTSIGQARLGKVDPDALVGHPTPGLPDHLRGATEFAGASAQEALATVRALLAGSTEDGEPLDTSRLYRALCEYFWELEAVLRTSLTLAARRLALPHGAERDWDGFLALYRQRCDDPGRVDAMRALDFSWHGEDLFEIRTYADWCRSGILPLETAIRTSDSTVLAVGFGPCHPGGQQVFLPDGLDRHITSAKRFVRTLLGLVPEP